MAWQAEASVIFRILINDFTEPYTYSDPDVQTTLVVAARYVAQEVNFSTAYTTDVGAETITPDPSTDDEFINFMVLKAACFIDQWGIRTRAAIEGVKAVAGPASLTVSSGNSAVGYRLLLEKGPCAAYEELKNQFNFMGENAINGCIRAVLSPFVSNNYSILQTSSSDRFRI